MNLRRMFKQEKVWTYSNLLSLSRLFIGMFLYYGISRRHLPFSFFLAILAVFTDFADGYLARKRNEISELGKILDPLGDKVTVALSAVALHYAYGLPLWIVLLIIGRDILILIGSVILIEKLQNVTASEMPGKIAVTIIAGLLLAYLLEWQLAKPILLYLTVLAVLISFFFYLLRFFKMIFKK
jgi:CDP-diacylglycerol--glycerol-3-phosphate 3-phosphatidyltransferase